MDIAGLYRDFHIFCRESMEWCAKEAEQSAIGVIAAIDFLLKDSARVSLMSKDTLAVLGRIKEIGDITGSNTHMVEEVIKNIKPLVGKDIGISEQLEQIVTALQFQDRVRQNMENLAKICATWFKHRSQPADPQLSIEEWKLSLGTKLFKCTTMEEERALIRAEFPGMPNDDINKAGDSLFF